MEVGYRQVGAASSLAARAEALNAVAEDLAGELMLHPLLERILLRCAELMGCDAGSISSVDEAAGTYRKEADIGVRCQSGHVFPLGEGMTGEVVRHRGPVWFDRYEDVVGGHISAEDRATLRGVIGVPLAWRGRIIGACVIFSRDGSRRFTAADADLLRIFARQATVAMVYANSFEAAEERVRARAAVAERERILDTVHDLLAQGLVGILADLEGLERLVPDGDAESAARLRRARQDVTGTVAGIRRALLGAGVSPLEGRSLADALRAELDWARRARVPDVRLVEAGTPVPLDPTLAQHVLTVAQEAIANIVRHSHAATARVGLVYDSASVSLLIQDDGQGFAPDADEPRPGLGLGRMAERVHAAGGSLTVDPVPGWGTSLRAWFPYRRTGAADARVEILVVAPQPVVRAGLARMLTWSDPTLAVVGEVATAAAATEEAARLHPAVVLVGSDLPAAADLIRAFGGADPPVRAVAVCPPDDPQTVVDMLVAGAQGCVETTAEGPALARVVAAAARGESVVPHGDLWEGRLSGDADAFGLTAREREVRALLHEGLTDRAIAERLVIAVKTVEKHVSAILRKTGARNRTELLAAASGGGRHRPAR